MKTNMNVLVEVYNPKKKESEWLPGKVVGLISGDVGENFERINVKLDDGRSFIGCHPDCVKGDKPLWRDRNSWVDNREVVA